MPESRHESFIPSPLDSFDIDGLPEETVGSDPDMYLLINKIQNDIAQHEALVERVQKRDTEYQVMKQAYEQKLFVLQHQMSEIQQERDLALKKMQDGYHGSAIGRKERINSAKTKYDQ